MIVSRFGQVSAEEHAYRLQLHQIPQQDVNVRKLRFTQYAPLVLAIYSISICIIFLTIYVRPYQEVTGTLSDGGGINWLTGEALLVLAGPAVVLPTALLAWRMIRKSYG